MKLISLTYFNYEIIKLIFDFCAIAIGRPTTWNIMVFSVLFLPEIRGIPFAIPHNRGSYESGNSNFWSENIPPV